MEYILYLLAGIATGYITGKLRIKINKHRKYKREKAKADSIWQAYADAGRTAEAIVAYRQFYISSPQDACDIVLAYQNKSV